MPDEHEMTREEAIAAARAWLSENSSGVYSPEMTDEEVIAVFAKVIEAFADLMSVMQKMTKELEGLK